MLRRFYDWMIHLSESRFAVWVLGFISFAESSFFPFPPDIMLVPMSVAQPRKAWFYATVCTITSVAGGIVGYAIGALLYETLGAWLISAYGYENGVEQFRCLYAEWGTWIILIKGLTPIPYKIVTITSGFAGYSLFWFVVFSAITRGARFFILAGILNYFGAPLRAFIEKHLTPVVIGFVLFLGAGVLASHYLFTPGTTCH
ncbi:YqaA family protein [Labrys monachus]|uniref:Membrane protein YqaA with SNARE-associated domain n=1 Tax=Labrys monachus TaxID=217067 RepID=A0ABU0FNI1_9HYPH|nr:YqaA family protein [Labrys monachus]MDQ0396169.1 membrane protein YqaA with SNARE-associated domain [Labrys monachus]